MIYLDNSATTRVFDEAAQRAYGAMTGNYANPAGAYRFALETDREVEKARGRLAKAMGAQSGEIIYTSGATESNNLAVFGTANLLRGRKRRFITTAVEHPSVFETFRALQSVGQDVVIIGVNRDGTARLDQLADALCETTALVSVMHVNNEVGSVNDIARAYALVSRLAPGALFHVDGVQAFCKLPFTRVPAHMYSISGHKFHAPKGVGALMVREGVRLGKGLLGGAQERGMRSGTLNTPGILGMDAALSHYMDEGASVRARLMECRARLMANILSGLSDVYVNGPEGCECAPHILNMSFPGVPGEVLLHSLEERGICVSTGSACSQRKRGSNRILDAMGIQGKRAESAVRFSLGAYNEVSEMDTAAEAVVECVRTLRRYAR